MLPQRQDGKKVIAYASRCIDRRERERPTASLVRNFFLSYWKQYMLGQKFVIRTDYSALTSDVAQMYPRSDSSEGRRVRNNERV